MKRTSFLYRVGLWTVGLLACLCLVVAVAPQEAYAQDDRPIVRVVTTDGNVFIGTLLSEDETQIVIDARGVGEITVERANLRRMEEIDPDRIREGVYWFENPLSTRYLFGPSALGLRQGEGYYQNTWIFFNNVNYGISDNLSLGAGTVPVFLFGVSAVPLWLLPKISVATPAENLHVAAGAVLGGVIGADDGGGAGIVYGLTTYGTRDNNVSVGVGFGYAGADWSSTPAVSISGMARISRTLYLISENYFVPGIPESGVGSVALRWGPENFAVDFGLVRPLDVGTDFIGVPWLGVSIPFGR